MANRSMIAKMERARAQRIEAGKLATPIMFLRAGMSKEDMRALAAQCAAILADPVARKTALQVNMLKIGKKRAHRAERVRSNYAADDTGSVRGFEGYGIERNAAPPQRSVLTPDVYGSGSKLIKAGA